VTFEGTYEQVTGAGLAPLPVQRPIPLWIGGSTPPALRRAGRLADGWFPQVQPGPKLEEACRLVAEGATAAGRDPATIGMDGRVTAGRGDLAAVVESVGRWADAGATHVSVNTMGVGLTTVGQHLEALAALAPQLDLAPRAG
jgi:hypothetical protein